MKITNRMVNNAIKRKFIKPLKDGCDYNINKLNNEKKTKHNETISLLKQAHRTLINVNYNLEKYNLVDANTLLRAAFEYILMAMMIQFDEGVYKEFTTLGIQRDKTRVCEIIDKFRTHMNEICEPVFKAFNRKEKLDMLTELYDKMCNFTHSTLIVSTMIEITDDKEKQVVKLMMYQNYYFVKILHFVCLKYFTSDNKHYLDIKNVMFTYLFLMLDIGTNIKENKLDFSKYNDKLYSVKNEKKKKKKKTDIEKLKNEYEDVKNDIQENMTEFSEELLEFLN